MPCSDSAPRWDLPDNASQLPATVLWWTSQISDCTSGKLKQQQHGCERYPAVGSQHCSHTHKSIHLHQACQMSTIPNPAVAVHFACQTWLQFVLMPFVECLRNSSPAALQLLPPPSVQCRHSQDRMLSLKWHLQTTLYS